MKKICLAMPTHRECAQAIRNLVDEAAFAVSRFDTEVCVLVSDTSEPAALAANAAMVGQLQTPPGVSLIHLPRDRQDRILADVLRRAGCDAVIAALMQPDGVSYGAATNRLFLFAEYFGCSSLHRRDSDSHYQSSDGQPVYPVYNELRFIGLPAREAVSNVDEVVIDAAHAIGPIRMVGASYVGETSIDVMPMFNRNEAASYEILGQFAPFHLDAAEKRRWVDATYIDNGQSRFEVDRAELAYAHSFLIDACNFCFYDIHAQVPMPPALYTIGSDYFLFSLMDALQLPVIHHNRHIDNFYTDERRTPQGFIDYQFRMVKNYLYMTWLHDAIAAIRANAETVLDARRALAPAALWMHLARPIEPLLRINREKLDILVYNYQSLGDEYAEFAAQLQIRRDVLLDEFSRDVTDFATLARVWPSLMNAARDLHDNANRPEWRNRHNEKTNKEDEALC
ncbi:DUF6271 family protein [Jeongeupia naejangsanensis]|uniref:Uncharacterized protein n=1 Tax=Jeongeupia naejangsanensis TaxID=613195 RepID=A0ABS2BLN2_9NEIS|nr:DUF6271 family protein [Jeongeupia naejangsanensis]MBM3116488.1 hypothetical protein [Jeongeupia naejangsanensis]